ncbi:hypothetical protein CEV33_4995, partial [Brucella grignonensis]
MRLRYAASLEDDRFRRVGLFCERQQGLGQAVRDAATGTA